jgi:LuxR family maltose regulon positive regulatory protein
VFDGLDIVDETGVQLWSYHLLSNGVAGTLGVGDLDTACELLERMKDYEHGARTLDRSLYHYHRAWLAMLRGDFDTARREQREALFQAEAAGCPFNVVLCRLALAQVLVEQGEIVRAEAELRKVHRIVRKINNSLLEYTSLLCFADMAITFGRRRIALRALRRGLQVGREHGFKYFLGWLPVVTSRICALALDEGIEIDYMQYLIRERALTPPADGRGRALWPWPMAIRTFGGFRVQQRDAAGSKLSGKPLGLLKAMVGLNGGSRVDESKLAQLLWLRYPTEYARRSLTTALHRLRKMIGEDQAVVLRHGRLSIARDLCRMDVDALNEAFADIDALYGSDASAATAVTLAANVLDVYQGPFMDGNPQTEYATARERVRNRVLGALDQLARVCESAGAPQQALVFFRRAIEQDPLAEAFHRRLMLMLREVGRAVEVVEAYARCKSLLEAARAGPPSPETQAIFEVVKRDL